MTWLFRCSERGGRLSGDHPGPQAAPVHARAPVRTGVGAVSGRGHDQAESSEGTKLRTNASKRKAMSYARMPERRRSSPRGLDEAEDAKSARTGVATSCPRYRGVANPAGDDPGGEGRPHGRGSTGGTGADRDDG